MPSTFGDFERSSDPREAIGLATEICRREDLELSYASAGQSLKTVRCELSDRYGVRVLGKGKGIGDQSTASALFEALEHYYYETESIGCRAETRRLDLRGADERLANASPDLLLLFREHAVRLSRLSFDTIHGQEDPLLFPAFLTNPDYLADDAEEQDMINRLRLFRYSTNSGTAAGSNRWEALLHALLELIERDAVGIELLRTVIRLDPAPVRSILRDALSEELHETCWLAERETAARLSLWDITTELGIPVILASLTESAGSGRCYFGSGCSLSAMYAVERAVLEAVQCFHNYTTFGILRPHNLGSRSEKTMSLYRRCFLEAGAFMYRGGSSDVRLRETATGLDSLTPQDQVLHLAKVLRENGMVAYARTIHDGGVHVVQAVVPELERFHLVSYGIPVAPAARGRKAISRSPGKHDLRGDDLQPIQRSLAVHKS